MMNTLKNHKKLEVINDYTKEMAWCPEWRSSHAPIINPGQFQDSIDDANGGMIFCEGIISKVLTPST